MSAPTLTNVQLHDPSGNAKTAFLVGDPMVLEFDYSDADTVPASSQEVSLVAGVQIGVQTSPVQTITFAVPVPGYDQTFVDSVVDNDNAWSKVSDVGGHLIWHAVAQTTTSTGQAVAHVVDAEGNTGSATVDYSVAEPPPPPPPTSSTRFGASVNSADDVTRLKSLGLTVQAARVFFTSAPPATWAGSAVLASLPAGTDVIVSWKSGTPAQIQAFLASRPKTLGRVYATYWHEPEDNFTTTAQQSAYRSTWAQYAPAIRAAGCIPSLILMRYTLAAGSGRNWRDWFPAGSVDRLFWDAYNSGNKATPGTYNDPTGIYQICKTTSDGAKLPWGITETGSPIVSGSTAAQRAAWAKQLAAAAKTLGAEVATWWDDGSTGGFDSRLDAPAAAAWGSQE